MDHRYAILIDGGFFIRKLFSKLGRRNPTVEDVVAEIGKIRDNPAFSGYELLRTYYYDALPATGKVTHPITGAVTNLADTKVYTRNKAFLQKLELQPDISLRAGEVSTRGYKLHFRVLSDKTLPTRVLKDDDFVLDLEQKGVDRKRKLDGTSVSA